MRKRIFVCIMSAVASLSLVLPVSAASAKRMNYARQYTDVNGDGICDYFVDKNGDGICDNCTGIGRRGGRYFVDSNGDGICDNYNKQGGWCGRRGRQGCGRF